MFPPIRTGTSFYSANLAESLVSIGHNVTVVTVKNDGAGQYEGCSYNVERIPALHIPIKNYMKHFRICSLLPGNYFRMNRIFRDVNPDIVLVVNHYLDIVFPALFLSFVKKVPIICSVGTQLQSCNTRRNRILNIFDRLICGNLIFPFCNKIIVWDNEIKRYLMDVHDDRFDSKYRLIKYGINGDIGEFIEHKHSYALKNQIIGVGAVSEQRNFVALVEGFALIADRYPDVKLKIIGHVYFDLAVKRSSDLKLGDRITFVGELHHDDVLLELKQSDVFYSSLTADYVGLGTATVESMLMGIPTIVNSPSDLFGENLLIDMEHVALIDSLSPEIIASKLTVILERRDLRENIGMNGRLFIQQNLNWEKVSADMECLFQEVLDSGDQ